MTYELAKKLKDAGFPQRIKQGSHFFDEDSESLSLWLETEDLEFHFPQTIAVKIPTLSELIEATKERFFRLSYFTPFQQEPHWTVETDGALMIEKCATPEEAVANLWLALHANNKTI